MSTLFTSKQLQEVDRSLEQVIQKVQAEVVMKRVRIREFFRDFDTLRKGTVTEQQFKRAIHISNISVSEREMNIILSHYKVDALANGLVRYSDFCEEVDRVFTTKGIDKDPLAQVT